MELENPTTYFGSSFFNEVPDITTNPPTTPHPPSDNTSHCNYYRKNSTIIILPVTYEGIPQNLLINFVAWMVCSSLYK